MDLIVWHICVVSYGLIALSDVCAISFVQFCLTISRDFQESHLSNAIPVYIILAQNTCFFDIVIAATAADPKRWSSDHILPLPPPSPSLLPLPASSNKNKSRKGDRRRWPNIFHIVPSTQSLDRQLSLLWYGQLKII